MTGEGEGEKTYRDTDWRVSAARRRGLPHTQRGVCRSAVDALGSHGRRGGRILALKNIS